MVTEVLGPKVDRHGIIPQMGHRHDHHRPTGNGATGTTGDRQTDTARHGHQQRGPDDGQPPPASPRRPPPARCASARGKGQPPDIGRFRSPGPRHCRNRQHREPHPAARRPFARGEDARTARPPSIAHATARASPRHVEHPPGAGPPVRITALTLIRAAGTTRPVAGFFEVIGGVLPRRRPGGRKRAPRRA